MQSTTPRQCPHQEQSEEQPKGPCFQCYRDKVNPVKVAAIRQFPVILILCATLWMIAGLPYAALTLIPSWYASRAFAEADDPEGAERAGYMLTQAKEWMVLASITGLAAVALRLLF